MKYFISYSVGTVDEGLRFTTGFYNQIIDYHPLQWQAERKKYGNTSNYWNGIIKRDELRQITVLYWKELTEKDLAYV